MSYLLHLRKDKTLGQVLRNADEVELTPQRDIGLWLCYSVISQQLSVAAATTIKKRFNSLFTGKPSAEKILKIPMAKLRSAGLSEAKSNYVRNVAQFEIEEGLKASAFRNLNDEEAIAYLTQIKGVGRWTAEMLLIFALARPDVFSPGDFGIRQAMTKLYGIRKRKEKDQIRAMIKISEKWSPYRSYGCLHLWSWKDGG